MTLFARAAQGLALSPAERALLKLLKGWLYTAFSAALVAGAQYLGTGQLDLVRLGYIAGGAFVLSVLHALDKFFSAKGDAALSLATEAVTARVEQVIPPPVATAAPVIAQPATPLIFNSAAQNTNATNALPMPQIVQFPAGQPVPTAATNAYPGPLSLPTSDRGFTALEMQAAQVQH